MKKRHIGQVSFNLLDEYELRLYEHASKSEHGRFSQYIKRLIERDREGFNVATLRPVIPLVVEDEEENIIAAGGFL